MRPLLRAQAKRFHDSTCFLDLNHKITQPVLLVLRNLQLKFFATSIQAVHVVHSLDVPTEAMYVCLSIMLGLACLYAQFALEQTVGLLRGKTL